MRLSPGPASLYLTPRCPSLTWKALWETIHREWASQLAVCLISCEKCHLPHKPLLSANQPSELGGRKPRASGFMFFNISLPAYHFRWAVIGAHEKEAVGFIETDSYLHPLGLAFLQTSRADLQWMHWQPGLYQKISNIKKLLAHRLINPSQTFKHQHLLLYFCAAVGLFRFQTLARCWKGSLLSASFKNDLKTVFPLKKEKKILTIMRKW